MNCSVLLDTTNTNLIHTVFVVLAEVSLLPSDYSDAVEKTPTLNIFSAPNPGTLTK